MKSSHTAALFLFVSLSIPLLRASAGPSDAASSAPPPSGNEGANEGASEGAKESASGAASASAEAGPPTDPLSAATFAGTTKAPPESAWKDAVLVTGVRIGADAARHDCRVKHVAEWVRVICDEMSAARVDLLAGEKRDFTIIGASDGYHGENMKAQFSMRPGDRRIIQWIMPDLWSDVWPGDNGDWMTGGPTHRGPILGVSLQVDWASGPEPIIAIY